MPTLDLDQYHAPKVTDKDDLRDFTLNLAKNFKTSWLGLGQALSTVWEDKRFYQWGFDKFEEYTEKELGINKSACMKLIKSYDFISDNEAQYLQKDFFESREANLIPGCDEINFLRLAKSKKELENEDYKRLREEVFNKGKTLGEVRKDLSTIMKERKVVDSDEVRAHRTISSIRKVIESLSAFEKDMDTLKLIPENVIQEALHLKEKLQEHLG